MANKQMARYVDRSTILLDWRGDHRPPSRVRSEMSLYHVLDPVMNIICKGCIVQPSCTQSCSFLTEAFSRIHNRANEDERLTSPYKLVPQTSEESELLQVIIHEEATKIYEERNR